MRNNSCLGIIFIKINLLNDLMVRLKTFRYFITVFEEHAKPETASFCAGDI